MHEGCTPNKEQLLKLGIKDNVLQTWNKSEALGLTDVWSDIKWYGRKKRHSCEKPAELIERLVLLSTESGDLVVDPFMGCGVAGEVCEKLSRRYIGFEIEERVTP